MELLKQGLARLETEKTGKVLFVETLHLKGWNGYTARYSKGISGTHSASMYLAEEFAARGFQVDFASPNVLAVPHLDVNYINVDEADVDIVYDMVFMTNNLLDLQIINKVIHYKNLFILMNNPLINPQLINLFKIERRKVVVAYVSQASKEAICLQNPLLNNLDSMLLYNSINVKDLAPISQKEDAFVFFACSDRGYRVAEKVADAFPTFKLYSNTYANELKYLLREQTKNSGKNEVFKCLAKSKYFVYPLVNTEKGCMHYDTFAYVILEALLHGVIVISVRNPVFKELYGDAICYVEMDDIMSFDCFKTWSSSIKTSVDFSMFLSVYTGRFIEKIKMLEQNEPLRFNYIRKGLALRDTFSSQAIFSKLLNTSSAFSMA
jgi:glycosyltransferase involved in cell wall biosynthesis